MPTLLPPKRVKEPRLRYTGDPDDYRLTLVEHLEELRDRIIRSVWALAVTWAIGWFAFPFIYSVLSATVNAAIREGLPKGHPFIEVFDTMTEPFFLKFQLSFLIGVILGFPFIVLQLWGFVAPALRPNEQKPFRKLAPASVVLFFMGSGFAWLVTPSALKWFVSYLVEFPSTGLYQHAGVMVYFILKMLLAFGFAFQLPLIVYGLGLAGLLTAETLMKHWRASTVVIFVVAMVVTPSQDPLTMLMMAIPLCILFMLSVWAVKFVQRGRDIGSPDDYTIQ